MSPLLVNRENVLAAAARIYAEHGFRGATTRRIARAAGVNEVTLFRLFGSKEALIAEAVRSHAPTSGGAGLPEVPVDPAREVSEWARAQLAMLRDKRALIRKTMGELAERPEGGPCVSRAPMAACGELSAYVERLRRRFPARLAGSREASAAVAMLMGVLFADAMGRDLMPDMYPHPESRAPTLYARLFLRALGLAGPRAPRRART